MLRTTAWTERLQRKYKKSTKLESPQRAELSPADIVHAEETLIKHVQEGLQLDVNRGKYKELLPTVENGIIVVGGRAERWISSTWNREKFVLLPAKHRFSFLVAEQAHIDSGHLGVEATIARIRTKYWIIGVRRMVRSIVARCKICKLKFKKLQ